MKKLILLLFLTLSNFIFSQEDEGTYMDGFGIWTNNDKKAYIFADICNVRAEADQKSEVLGKLFIGNEVQITKVTTIPYSQNGIKSTWIKIKAGPLQGYVWGGMLTNQVEKLKDNTTVLWGITDVKTTEEKTDTYASIRIIEKESIKTKFDFIVKYGSRPMAGSLEVKDAPLINETLNLITFNTYSEACGEYASQHYFLYSTSKVLHSVGSGYSMADGGVLGISKTYIFPYPEEDNFQGYHYTPNKEHIFCVENTGEYDEECIWVEITKVIDFVWDGKGLVKSCDY